MFFCSSIPDLYLRLAVVFSLAPLRPLPIPIPCIPTERPTVLRQIVLPHPNTHNQGEYSYNGSDYECIPEGRCQSPETGITERV